MADGGGGGGGGEEEEDGTVLPDTPWSAISEGEMDARVEALMREREALQSAAREVAAAREGLHALGQDDPLRGVGGWLGSGGSGEAVRGAAGGGGRTRGGGDRIIGDEPR